ncbi:DEAD/DEAH box helicase [Paractinoplanes rishiriensis]|uniref:Helicase n=1 Tax=Paractinoplanes rishiriensis TaxID=1050105 RepID=A0A919MVP2_9ACTN|nr:DEAD/DEAH box helicase [Actinoplanes rishiriensis]GIF01632.1 helicase [Actinoplanes rishiriensis]
MTAANNGVQIPGEAAAAALSGPVARRPPSAMAQSGHAALREYQHEALEAVTARLGAAGRGMVVAACGTGKTLTAAHAAARLCPSGLVVVTCPTLALLAQILRVWTDGALASHVLAVCGDSTVADAGIRLPDLACPVTTNVREITRWLRTTPASRSRLMLATHASAGRAGRALLAADTVAELLVVDEAHHTAGRVDKHTALVHDDTRLPARRRLYMTATPRVLAVHHRRGRPPNPENVVSMDDTAIFGPVLYTYPFAKAIDDGWLDNFRVAVIGVTHADVLALLRKTEPAAVVAAAEAPLRTAVVQTALARAAVEFGLRRVLVFNRLIAESQEFTRTLHRTIDSLPDDQRPKGPLTAVHVDGDHTVDERQRSLALLADPPNNGWTVLSNARCLSEGVDVPAVDGVVFTRPKSSEVDVVQAVGRALRRNPNGTGIATILVPVLLPDDPDAILTDLDEWATMWQVVRALRAHDSVLAAELDTQRSSPATGPAQLPQRILIRLPDGYGTADVLRHITVKLLEYTTSDWLAGYSALRDFHTRHGHLRIPRDHIDRGINLKQWLGNRRRDYHNRLLAPDEITALEALGIDWSPMQTAWERGLAAAQAFHAREGHLNVPMGHRENDVKLNPWVTYQRRERALGHLTAERIHALDQIGIEWDPIAAIWNRALTAATTFYQREGHLDVPTGHRENNVDLHEWLRRQHRLARQNKLSDAKTTALRAIGFITPHPQPPALP